VSKSKKLIVKDTIHGFIRLDLYPFIEEIINTIYFQRLRRLSQLGISIFVYPTATHNRFTHSIGAMHVFTRIYDQLKNHMPNKKDEIECMRKLGIATILLHDIGHGPFSHTSESVFKFKHEEITKKIIANTRVKDVLEHENIDPKKIIAILDSTVTGSEVLLSQLITSQLDADRLDYLSRDAYFTGVGFGNIDLERLINIMTLYDGDGLLKDHAISLNKGLHSLESYVLTRHLMYQGVYFHKTTRGVEMLVRKIFERIKELKDKIKLPTELDFLETSNPPSYHDVLALDDHFIYAQIAHWSKHEDPILSELCKRILNRDLLKAIEIPEDKMIAFFDSDKFRSIAERNGVDFDYFCGIDNPSDAPYTPYQLKPPDDKTHVITNIFLLNNKGEPQEISFLSDVVKALSTTKYSYRFYCPEVIKKEISKSL